MSLTSDGAENSAPEPLIRVVRGTPTPEELAALISVLVKQGRPEAAPWPGSRSLWTLSARPGFGRRRAAWRAGVLPGIQDS